MLPTYSGLHSKLQHSDVSHDCNEQKQPSSNFAVVQMLPTVLAAMHLVSAAITCPVMCSLTVSLSLAR